MRRALWFAGFVFAGCATTAPAARDTPVELSVRGLDTDMAIELEKELKSVPELQSARLKNFDGGVAVYVIDYRGDSSSLLDALKRIKKPGLKNTSTVVKVECDGFDNAGPIASVLYPSSGSKLASRQTHVLVAAPDKDVKEVLVNGHVATRFRGEVFRVPLELDEGSQQIVTVVRDLRDNLTTVKTPVTVDVGPDAMAALEKKVAKGSAKPGDTLLVEGQTVQVFPDGFWRIELVMRKGVREVDVVSVDEKGRRVVRKVALSSPVAQETK